MMKIKTADLTGPALNWVVAKVEGENYRPVTTYNGIGHEFPPIDYSTDWAQGGPIIEREEISIGKADDPNWWAFKGWKAEDGTPGPTPLIAAMRCFVTSRLGDEVEVPAELIGD